MFGMTSTGARADADGPERIWTPAPDQDSALARFTRWVAEHRDVQADDYSALLEWSITDLDGFWSGVADFAGVLWHDRPTATLARSDDAGGEVVPRRHAQLRGARATARARRR
jgi:acetoacetyl-CoA synthetase